MASYPIHAPVLPLTPHPSDEALDLCVRTSKPSSPAYNFGFNPNLNAASFYDHPIQLAPMRSPVSETSSSESLDSPHCHLSPDPTMSYSCPTSPQQKPKATRPFKAFPKNPMPLILPNGDPIMDQDSTDAYIQFRNHMLSQLQSQNIGTNKNMRRISTSSQNGQNGDPTYWEKRRKNNEAAKRSRDARRAKEDEIAIRCAFLEQENLRLKFKLATVEEQLKHTMYR